MTTYCLWAFDRYNHLDVRARGGHLIWFELSIVPFVLAVLSVELAVERGLGGEPEELASRTGPCRCSLSAGSCSC